jgi:uncharacterized repeat protein (TIGR01451 family)
LSLNSAAALASGGVTTGNTTNADVQISGSASTGSPSAGSNFTYTFQLKNSGPGVAVGAALTDPLPAGTGFAGAVANGSSTVCNPSTDANGVTTVNCALGDMASGTQQVITLNVTGPAAAGTYTNTATAGSTVTDPQPSNNQSVVTIKVAGADPTSTGSCVSANMSSSTGGVNPTDAGIWTQYGVGDLGCSGGGVSFTITDVNQSTGLVEFSKSGGTSQGTSGVADFEQAKFATAYIITLRVVDSRGNVQALQTTEITTPAAPA